jgi:hypothetical protein
MGGQQSRGGYLEWKVEPTEEAGRRCDGKMSYS